MLESQQVASTTHTAASIQVVGRSSLNSEPLFLMPNNAVVPMDAPTSQLMSNVAFDMLPNEKGSLDFTAYDLEGKEIKGLVTDKRILLRTRQGVCFFPFNLCCICFKGEVDDNYAVADLKIVQPYMAEGCTVGCYECMFSWATKYDPFCCCLPKLLPNGVRLGFARAVGDYVPMWSFWPFWSCGTGNSFATVTLQMKREEALKLRSTLAAHPGATGLGHK